MYSKNIFCERLRDLMKVSLAVVVAAGLLSGCDAKVGEQPPPPTTQEFNGTECLTDVLPHLTTFIHGESTDQNVNETWGCFSTALEKFKKYVRGRSADRYTPQELSTFLEDNFFDNSRGHKVISPALQAEVMKFKQIFLGGSADYLTMDDLDHAIQLFETFRTMTLKINPYMKVFALNWSLSNANDIQADTQFFEDANVQVQELAKELAALVQKNHPAYTLSDFVVFMRELNSLYDEPWPFLAKVEQFMPVVQKIKKAIAGGDERTVAPTEWRSFLLLGARGYVQYLRYHYFISSAPATGTGIRLSYIARAMEDGISVFQDLVAEKPSGIVSRDEVADLLNTVSQAWPQFRVSDELIYEFMKLKQLFIGGSVDSFTITDFSTARLKVPRLKTLIERFLPYYSVYGLDWDPAGMTDPDAQKFFNEAQFNLEATSQELGALLETSYDLNDFYSLVHELVSLYPERFSKDASIDQTIEKYLPFVGDIKNMVYGDQDSIVKKDQWSSLLRFVARGYSTYLYEQYFFKNETLTSARGLSSINVLVNQGLNIMRDLMALNPKGYFAQSALSRVAQRAVDSGLVSDSFDSQVMNIVLDVVLNRVLVDPADRIGGAHPSALTPRSLEVLRTEFSMWAALEKDFLSFFPQGDESYTSSEIQRVMAEEESNSGGDLRKALHELNLSLVSPVPITFNKHGNQIISRSSQVYKKNSLSQLNLDREIARILIRSYAGSLSRINNYQGITLAEAEKAFADLRPAAIKMGLIEPDNTTFASSRFREANIFVAHADGNSYASFAEATDLVGMIWSGVLLDSDLKKELISTCIGSGTTNSQTMVKVSCLESVYHREMPGIMGSLPDYLKYMNGHSRDDWNTYFENVLKSAGYVPNGRGTAKLGDVALVPHVVQYIEMIYAKYDRDRNGYLDAGEALKAFPVFEALIKQFAAGAVADKDLDSVFTYILRYGKPPETWLEKIGFLLNWKGKPEKWDVWADRTQLSKILGYIADQVAASPSASVKMPDLADAQKSVGGR